MIIRRIDVLSAAKMGGFIGLAIGLIAGILFFLMSSLGGVASALAQQDSGMGWAMGMGVLALVILPVMYAVCGFIGGAIQSFVYNIAAKYVGGIRIETE